MKSIKIIYIFEQFTLTYNVFIKDYDTYEIKQLCSFLLTIDSSYQSPVLVVKTELATASF